MDDIDRVTGCDGKVGHDTVDEALRALNRTTKKFTPRRGPVKGPIVPYYCPGCGKWHLGHTTPGSPAFKKRKEFRRGRRR